MKKIFIIIVSILMFANMDALGCNERAANERQNHKGMMLSIKNPFDKIINYSADICLLKYGKWVTTDVYDVLSEFIKGILYH